MGSQHIMHALLAKKMCRMHGMHALKVTSDQKYHSITRCVFI